MLALGDCDVEVSSLRATVLLVAWSIALGACQERRSFPPVGVVTRAEVRETSHADVELTDPAQLAALVTFIDARRDGWEVPWAGVPVGTISVTLYRGPQVLGSFGAGAEFFDTQRDGAFFSRPASPTEVQRFRELLRARGVR